MTSLTPEHDSRQVSGGPHPEVTAAYKYVDSVISTADAQFSPLIGFAWHGWALREAFLAGCTHARVLPDQQEAPEPIEPVWADIHYAWELLDAEGEWQAGGSANSLDDVQREGNRCLQTYLQDGPHKLIIQRHCVNTIKEVTNG